MHDCPTCQVPLHGHEEVCPSCGTKQYVRPEYRRSNLPKPPGINPLPFIIAGVIGVVGIVFAVQNSWIGQLLSQKPQQEDPIDKMTMLEARQAIETQIMQGLGSVGAKGTFKYTEGTVATTKDAAKAVELTIDTQLKDPNSHKAIIDPVKPYMAKAQVITLTMNDAKTHATWTYTVSAAAPSDNEQDKPAGQQ